MNKKNKIPFAVLSIILLSAVIFTTCTKEEPELYGDIYGNVYKDGTTEGIQGATVILSPGGDTKTTGSDGSFVFTGLKIAEYKLTASKDGYQTNIKTITINAGDNKNTDILLKKEDAGQVVVTTTPVSSSETEATAKGNITSIGSEEITGHGHVQNTSPAPTIELETKIDYGKKTSTGEFTSSITSLKADTKYYVRAFATTSSETVYSTEVNFTTNAEATIPIVTTSEVTNISIGSASSGGNVTSDGTSAITEKGVCWNTSGSPTTTDNKTSDGTGSGTFISNINGLSASTKY